jgi:hypothetical protein
MRIIIGNNSYLPYTYFFFLMVSVPASNKYVAGVCVPEEKHEDMELCILLF